MGDVLKFWDGGGLNLAKSGDFQVEWEDPWKTVGYKLRILCPTCGKIYSKEDAVIGAGKCWKCGVDLVVRKPPKPRW